VPRFFSIVAGLSATLLLTGCASSGPVSIGPNTYMMADTGARNWSSGAAPIPAMAQRYYGSYDSQCRRMMLQGSGMSSMMVKSEPLQECLNQRAAAIRAENAQHEAEQKRQEAAKETERERQAALAEAAADAAARQRGMQQSYAADARAHSAAAPSPDYRKPGDPPNYLPPNTRTPHGIQIEDGAFFEDASKMPLATVDLAVAATKGKCIGGGSDCPPRAFEAVGTDGYRECNSVSSILPGARGPEMLWMSCNHSRDNYNITTQGGLYRVTDWFPSRATDAEAAALDALLKETYRAAVAADEGAVWEGREP
jgi:hypothetical protein